MNGRYFVMLNGHDYAKQLKTLPEVMTVVEHLKRTTAPEHLRVEYRMDVTNQFIGQPCALRSALGGSKE